MSRIVKIMSYSGSQYGYINAERKILGRSHTADSVIELIRYKSEMCTVCPIKGFPGIHLLTKQSCDPIPDTPPGEHDSKNSGIEFSN
jgi:hypothetical protein